MTDSIDASANKPPTSQTASEQPTGDDKTSKNALKKAQKEKERAEAKAKKKEKKALDKVTQDVAAISTNDHDSTPKVKSKQGANYNIGLKNTQNGVVTRFPPEPSGHLHIGHAKAALLNDYFAHEYKDKDNEDKPGKLILRFDDTNPTNEKLSFQESIVTDLALMGIKPDTTSYTSDYFEELYKYCVRMITTGHAYTDDTEQETMKIEREKGIKSKRRDESVEDNLARFEEMKTGSEEGQRWCVRARLSVDDPNRALRDPVIYRCNTHPHHRTGESWKVYPTYHFACPIVDSLEGVTHALRTIEYRDWNPHYAWTLKALNLRHVEIWDFARLNFIRTLLSKRKLTKLVDKGVVSGWNDPRFPTVSGIRRRGMTIEALRDFMVRQGPSKNLVLMDWTTFWATNKKVIDPIAPRHTAIVTSQAVKCTVLGADENPKFEMKDKHNKNPEVGKKKVWFSKSILIEQEDAKAFAQDEEITLMSWGNAFVRKISHSINPLQLGTVTSMELELHLEGDVKKTEKKVTWLSEDQELVRVELVEFDHLLSKDKLEENDDWEEFLTPKTEFRTEAVADCNVSEIKEDDIIQFERKGYFRCDESAKEGKRAVFFEIPSGKSK